MRYKADGRCVEGPAVAEGVSPALREIRLMRETRHYPDNYSQCFLKKEGENKK